MHDAMEELYLYFTNGCNWTHSSRTFFKSHGKIFLEGILLLRESFKFTKDGIYVFSTCICRVDWCWRQHWMNWRQCRSRVWRIRMWRRLVKILYRMWRRLVKTGCTPENLKKKDNIFFNFILMFSKDK